MTATDTDSPIYVHGRPPDWSLVPEHMIGAMRRYIEHGLRPGHFLSALLANDLVECVGRADDINRHRIADYIIFLYNYAPRQCFGSPAKVTEWIAKGGLGLKQEASS